MAEQSAPQGAVNETSTQEDGTTKYLTTDVEDLPKGIDGENPVSVNNPDPKAVNDPALRERFLKGDAKVNAELGVVEDKADAKKSEGK